MEKIQESTAPLPLSPKTDAPPTKLFLFHQPSTSIDNNLTVYNLHILEPSKIINRKFLIENQDFLAATENFASSKNPETMLAIPFPTQSRLQPPSETA